MPFFPVRRHKRLLLAFVALLIVLLPYGCSRLAYKERELIFSIEPGTANWFKGLPEGVEQLDIPLRSATSSAQHVHAWWWPASSRQAPVALYLHGTRWNLTAQLGRITQLRALGFSILAIDYRGFGQSPGELPSERSVYEDAQAAWQHLAQLQPDASRRFIYGHSLGGAIATDLASRIGRGEQPGAAGLIIESTFTDMGAAAQAVIGTSLPVRWLLSEKFDSIDKIAHIGMPVLIVHGTDDRYVPDRFSRELYEAAEGRKQLLLVPGGTHNNSMIVGANAYAQALQEVFGMKTARN